MPTNNLLVIDNYDSFTYNIVQQYQQLQANVTVWRNDTFTLEQLSKHNPDAIIISPGPGTPVESGLTNEVIKTFSGTIPILGVCLGMQAMGEVFGGDVIKAPELMHGKVSQVEHTQTGLFKNLPSPLECTRYHSLIVDRNTLPDCLEVIATTNSTDRYPGLIMGLTHKEHLTVGVQFHPESYLSQSGPQLFKNFLTLVHNQ